MLSLIYGHRPESVGAVEAGFLLNRQRSGSVYSQILVAETFPVKEREVKL